MDFIIKDFLQLRDFVVFSSNVAILLRILNNYKYNLALVVFVNKLRPQTISNCQIVRVN